LSIEYNLKRLHYLKNYLDVARMVKEIVLKHEPHAEVYVFGSVVKGNITAMSDIDIIIVSERKELEYKIKIEVLKSTDAPLELHFATPTEYLRWYKRFIDSEIKL